MNQLEKVETVLSALAENWRKTAHHCDLAAAGAVKAADELGNTVSLHAALTARARNLRSNANEVDQAKALLLEVLK